MNRFPETLERIIERKYSGDPAPLIAFGMAVARALDRVWIVDEYFFMPDEKTTQMVHMRIAKILTWLPSTLEASDIRILTKTHREVAADALIPLKEREADINRLRARRPVKCSIEVRHHLTKRFDYIHDRFAIVDDELWHFGGTAGGFHASVSAASRGWSAVEHGAIKFFEMAWNAGGKNDL